MGLGVSGVCRLVVKSYLHSISCERENKWLDEADYTVDTALIPRGGHRRRKSMEPKMLANMNGNLVAAETPAKDMSPTKEFLTFDTPASRRDTFVLDQQRPLRRSLRPTMNISSPHCRLQRRTISARERSWCSKRVHRSRHKSCYFPFLDALKISLMKG